jgi:ubiquinone/menaquinone biosynthesis C-methylase UbiE
MSKFVCPHWVGYWLASPLRRLIHNPEKILAPFVKSGMTVLDVGPAMGFFSLPLAGLVGPDGKVICVDVQEKMLLSLQRRALAANLVDRLLLRTCNSASLCLEDFNGSVDFVLVFAVVHEVADVPIFFSEISRALKPEGVCLVAEPKGHVSISDFGVSLAIAGNNGLGKVGSPGITWCHSALLKKDR